MGSAAVFISLFVVFSHCYPGGVMQGETWKEVQAKARQTTRELRTEYKGIVPRRGITYWTYRVDLVCHSQRHTVGYVHSAIVFTFAT